MGEQTIFLGIGGRPSAKALCGAALRRFPQSSPLRISPAVRSTRSRTIGQTSLQENEDLDLAAIEDKANLERLWSVMWDYHTKSKGICLIDFEVFRAIRGCQASWKSAVILILPGWEIISEEEIVLPSSNSPPEEWPLGLGPATVNAELSPQPLLDSISACMQGAIQNIIQVYEKRFLGNIKAQKETLDRKVDRLHEKLKSRYDEAGNRMSEARDVLNELAKQLKTLKTAIDSQSTVEREVGTSRIAAKIEETRERIAEGQKAAAERVSVEPAEKTRFPLYIVSVVQAGMGLTVVLANFKQRFLPTSYRIEAEDEESGPFVPMSNGIPAGTTCFHINATVQRNQCRLRFWGEFAGKMVPLTRSIAIHLKVRVPPVVLLEIPSVAQTEMERSEYDWLNSVDGLLEGAFAPSVDSSAANFAPQNYEAFPGNQQLQREISSPEGYRAQIYFDPRYPTVIPSFHEHTDLLASAATYYPQN